MRNVLILLAVIFCAVCARPQQQLSVRWEELTAEDFRSAIQKSQGTCLLPFGILEKHGPHLPLGTDLLNVRHAALAAAQQEFAVVYPEYYFGQIFEARHALSGTLYTGIWWYARFPEHSSGDGSAATRELGEYDMQAWIAAIQKAIQAVKADKTSLQLQNEFFEKAKHPLDTPQ